MKVISPLLRNLVYPGLSKAGYLRWRKDSSPVVLTYHGILPPDYTPRDVALDGHLITAEAFCAQLKLLISQYNVISPDEFRLWCAGQAQLPPRSVLLTCDDGLLNTLTDMLPIIRDFGVHFLFFVTGASLFDHSSMLWYEQLYLWLHMQEEIRLCTPWRKDVYLAQTAHRKRALWQELIRGASALDASARRNVLEDMRIQIGISESWQAEYSQNEPLRRRFFMLNKSELEELAQAGMTIGAHTLSHPILSKMPKEVAWHEISGSRAEMQKLLQREVWALAYPFGTLEAMGKHESTLARRAGFTCAFTNVENSSGGSYLYPRIHVSSGMTLPELEAHLSGFDFAIRQAHSRMMARSS